MQDSHALNVSACKVVASHGLVPHSDLTVSMVFFHAQGEEHEAHDDPVADDDVFHGHAFRVQHHGRCGQGCAEGGREGGRQGPGLQGRQVLTVSRSLPLQRKAGKPAFRILELGKAVFDWLRPACRGLIHVRLARDRGERSCGG